MISLPGLALSVLAAPSPSPTPAKGGEGVKSGPIGLAVILVLCVVAYFLFKSMSKHLRRVREDFPVEPRPAGAAAASTASPQQEPRGGRDTDRPDTAQPDTVQPDTAQPETAPSGAPGAAEPRPDAS